MGDTYNTQLKDSKNIRRRKNNRKFGKQTNHETYLNQYSEIAKKNIDPFCYFKNFKCQRSQHHINKTYS